MSDVEPPPHPSGGGFEPPSPAAQPPVAPAVQQPPPAPTMPPPPPGGPAPKRYYDHKPDKGVDRGLIAGAILAGIISVLLGFATAVASSDLDSDGERYGAAFGILIFGLIVGGIVGATKSMRAGLITFIVIAGLQACAAVTQLPMRSATERQISEALEEQGVEPITDQPLSRSELRCIEAQGIDENDVLSAVTETGASGAVSQNQAIDAILECAPDFVLSDGYVEAFGGSYFYGTTVNATMGESRCILQAGLDNDRPRQALFEFEDPEFFESTMRNCLSVENADKLLGTGGPASYGDDPSYDQYHDLCIDGSAVACDLLFFLVSVEGSYYDTAFSCGGVPAGSERFCLEGMLDDDLDGFVDAASPGLAALEAQCVDGDMVACTLALFTTEIGSSTERVGETCGERLAVPPLEGCIERFGLLAE